MKTLLDTNPLSGTCTMCGGYSIQLRGHVCRECRPQDEPTMDRFDLHEAPHEPNALRAHDAARELLGRLDEADGKR